uniref:Uncharacterized protein n=1 Tax=Ditylenchus dipsaci TaxID=166011 RepID=A0A915CSC6_9BILA
MQRVSYLVEEIKEMKEIMKQIKTLLEAPRLFRNGLLCNKLIIRNQNYCGKVNDSLLESSLMSIPKYDQDDIQLLLGGEPREMMAQSPDSNGADAFEEEDGQESTSAEGKQPADVEQLIAQVDAAFASSDGRCKDLSGARPIVLSRGVEKPP